MDNSREKLSAQVEIAENGTGVLEIQIDRAAIDQLIKDLTALKDAGDHFHYFSEDWGGHNLTIDPHHPQSAPVHHIKITKV